MEIRSRRMMRGDYLDWDCKTIAKPDSHEWSLKPEDNIIYCYGLYQDDEPIEKCRKCNAFFLNAKIEDGIEIQRKILKNEQPIEKWKQKV